MYEDTPESLTEIEKEKEERGIRYLPKPSEIKAIAEATRKNNIEKMKSSNHTPTKSSYMKSEVPRLSQRHIPYGE